ncbi:hypothetical protein GCM10010284_67120 [Streptomyces rubiginosohelvolus]|uniref:hypothetical protein n=1 Tax=Streptomyces rubiginosohelvolus TaxID=67362 RepID=UPI001674E474|nr:hypothetical protein [Streptomyces rubiginosohelvolus]GGS24747.1 hypothetical protein GCM10010284_67120 [Streptomyces rubiginosohelvolus]
MSTSTHDRAYPEPAAHPNWTTRRPAPRLLTPAQQQRNREALLLAQHTPSPRRTRKNPTEAAR